MAINYEQAGTGAPNTITLESDVISSTHYQGIKLFDATTGSTNGLVVDASGRAVVKRSPELFVATGNMFLTGTGVLTLSAAGNATMLLTNPTGGSKDCRIWRISALASAGPVWGSLFINPTAGLPTTLSTQNNLLIGSTVTSPVTLASGTSLTTPLSGGTATGIVLGIPNGTHVAYDLPPLVLPPGYSLGLNVPFTGAASATVNVYYWLE